MTSLHLKEIDDVGHVYEGICERFDDALELIGPNTVVYGGAIRDSLADLELLGDLDLAVPPEDFRELRERFLRHARWVPDSEMNMKQLASKYGVSRSRVGSLSDISQFVNSNGSKVQLVVSKMEDVSPLNKALQLSRQVDIVCCAVAMTQDGRVFETIPEAFEDCRARVLRLNKTSSNIFPDTLAERIRKLENRGWKSEIDVAKALATINRKRAVKSGKTRSERVLPDIALSGMPKKIMSVDYRPYREKHNKCHITASCCGFVKTVPFPAIPMLKRLDAFAAKRKLMLDVIARDHDGEDAIALEIRGNFSEFQMVLLEQMT